MKNKLVNLIYIISVTIGLLFLAFNSQPNSKDKSIDADQTNVLKIRKRLDLNQQKMLGLTKKETEISCKRFKRESLQSFFDDSFAHCIDGELFKNNKNAGKECNIYVAELEILIEEAHIECLELISGKNKKINY